MCFKAGIDELDTVKNLMSMSLNALIAESLGVELDSITPDARLKEELGMGESGRAELVAGIAEYFDGLVVDLTELTTVGALLERVVLQEFSGLPVDCSLPESEPTPTSHAA